LVRDLTIAYYGELLQVSITRKGSSSTTFNMSSAIGRKNSRGRGATEKKTKK